MGQDADQTFVRLSLVGARPQGRAEEPLVAADGAFDLPAVAVDVPGETPLHLCPIPRLRRPMAPALIQGDHRGPDAQLLAAEPVVVLGVVGGVGQKAVKHHMAGSLPERFGKLGRVVAGASRHHHPGQKVRGGVADYRELGPLLAPKRHVAAAIHVIGAGMAGLQARGVNGPFGALINQSELFCSAKTSSDKRLESPLFSSLCCA